MHLLLSVADTCIIMDCIQGGTSANMCNLAERQISHTVDNDRYTIAEGESRVYGEFMGYGKLLFYRLSVTWCNADAIVGLLK